MSFTSPGRIFYADDANPRLYAMQMQRQATSIQTAFTPQSVAITNYIGWPGYTAAFNAGAVLNGGGLVFAGVTGVTTYGTAGTYSSTLLPSGITSPQVNVDGWYLIRGAFEFTYTGAITAGSFNYAQFTTSPALFSPDPTVTYATEEQAPLTSANGPGALVLQQTVALSAGDIISFATSTTNVVLINVSGSIAIHRLGDRFTS